MREDHYGVLTEALVIDKRQNISYSVQNPEMIRKGRPVPPGGLHAGARAHGPPCATPGEYQIQQSRKEEQAVTVTLPGSFGAFPGDRVELRLEQAGP